MTSDGGEGILICRRRRRRKGKSAGCRISCFTLSATVGFQAVGSIGWARNGQGSLRCTLFTMVRCLLHRVTFLPYGFSCTTSPCSRVPSITARFIHPYWFNLINPEEVLLRFRVSGGTREAFCTVPSQRYLGLFDHQHRGSPNKPPATIHLMRRKLEESDRPREVLGSCG